MPESRSYVLVAEEEFIHFYIIILEFSYMLPFAIRNYSITFILINNDVTYYNSTRIAVGLQCNNKDGVK